jgi:hypothetical protein
MLVVKSLTRDICPRGDDTKCLRRLRLCFRPGGSCALRGAAGQARLATQSVCILNDAQRSAEGLGDWLLPLDVHAIGLAFVAESGAAQNAIELPAPLNP